ncbi:hypothetical protein KXD40_005954 [Peronospora effusa]|nr:hypothetical protein KXD40_005954 [Peronospora effusa]
MFPYLLRKSHRMAADTKYCIVLTLAYEGRGVDEGIQQDELAAQMVIGMPWIWVRVLGSQLSSQIITCETTRVEAVSTELQHIMVLDYDPQESDFPLLLYSNRRGLAVSSIQQGRKLSLDFKIEMQSVQESIWQIRS